MKRCPECRRDYTDDSLNFCLDDGAELLDGPSSFDGPTTAILQSTAPPAEAATRAQIHTTGQTSVFPSGDVSVPKGTFDKRLLLAPVALAVIILGGFFAYRNFNSSNWGQINSIAVLPFEN